MSFAFEFNRREIYRQAYQSIRRGNRNQIMPAVKALNLVSPVASGAVQQILANAASSYDWRSEAPAIVHEQPCEVRDLKWFGTQPTRDHQSTILATWVAQQRARTQKVRNVLWRIDRTAEQIGLDRRAAELRQNIYVTYSAPSREDLDRMNGREA